MVGDAMRGLQAHAAERERALREGAVAAVQARGEMHRREAQANMARQDANDADTVRIKGSSTVLRDGSWSGPSLHDSIRVFTRRGTDWKLVYSFKWEGSRSKAAGAMGPTAFGRAHHGPLAPGREYASTKRRSAVGKGGKVRRRNVVRDDEVTFKLSDKGVTRTITNNKLAAVMRYGDGRIPPRDFLDVGAAWHARASTEVINKYIRGPQRQLNGARIARLGLRVIGDVIEVIGAAGGV